MAMLRDAEHGCPWDLEQTIDSLIPYTIEEVYEVVDAIERKSMVDLEDELGDLLFQVVFTRSSPEKQISFPSQTSLRRSQKTHGATLMCSAQAQLNHLANQLSCRQTR